MKLQNGIANTKLQQQIIDNTTEVMRMGNRWKSKYGDRYISLPSVIKDSDLDYELIEIK